MHNRLLYILSPFLLLLSGCFPHSYRGRPLPLECTDLCVNVAAAFKGDSLCPGTYPNETWWTFFQDPQLNYLIDLSLATHPDIKIAYARILLARQEALEVRSALFPHFFALGAISRDKYSLYSAQTFGDPAFQYITDASLYLTSALYQLDIWGKNRNAYYASLNQLFAEYAEYAEAKLVLSTTLASLYFDLQYNLELLRIAKERLHTFEKLYNLLAQRYQNNVIAVFDLYEVDLEIQKIKDLILQQESLVEIDRHALAALVGNPSCGQGDLCVKPAAIFDTPLPLPCTLPLDLLARRPDIIAQKYRIDSSCFNVAVAKARFFPKIDLLSFIGFTSINLAKLFTANALTWGGEGEGALPLFTGYKLEAKLGIAREEVEIAVETYNQLVLNAVQEVCDAMTELITADERLKVLKVAVKDANALYQLTTQRFVHKLDDQLAVLRALENLFIQEQQAALVQLDRFQAAVMLIQAIGGGYYDSDPPPLPSSNRRRTIWLLVLGLIFLVIGLLALLYWILIGRFYVYTEDAYVHGNEVMLTPQVSAGVKAIYADETDLVEKGQLIIELDTSDYLILFEEEKKSLASTVRNVAALFQDALAREAEVKARAAKLKQAKLDLEHRTPLVEPGAVSGEEFEIYQTAVWVAAANLEWAEKELDKSKSLIEGTTIATHPLVEEKIWALREAYLNLIRCQIWAPATGYIAKRSVQVGDQVKEGERLLYIVPLDQIWLEANYKENRLRHVRIGQPVEYTADMYGHFVKFHGKVLGFQPGSGNAFALLPPENASGNWIKIIQRVPVRISVDPQEIREYPLLLGLSMRTTIDIHDREHNRLAPIPTMKPLYTTEMYSQQIEDLMAIDPLIQDIISQNSP